MAVILGVIQEDMLVITSMGVGRYLKITLAKNGEMDLAVSCTKDDIAALLGVLSTVGMEEFELVGGRGLGAIVEMGTDLQGSGSEQGDVGSDDTGRNEHTLQMWSCCSTSTISETTGLESESADPFR